MPSSLRHLVLSPLILFWVALGVGCADRSTAPLNPPRTMAISPTVDTLANMGDTVQLTAVVNGQKTSPSEQVSWKSQNGAVATVDAQGLVRSVGTGTAPIVASVAGLADTALVVVLSPTLTQLVLAPASMTLAAGATGQFTVSGTWSDGSSGIPAVTYSATGGTINASGLYTAGTTPGTFAVIGTQQGGAAADTSVVTVIQPPAALTQLVLTPATVTLTPGGTAQFSVSGTWSDGSTAVPAVTYSATGGTITAGGLYTAGMTSGAYQVIATQQGGTKSDTSTVTVSNPSTSSLRLLAAARGFVIGAAVNSVPFPRAADSLYRKVLTTQFNSVTPEFAMQFSVIHPSRSVYDWSQADSIAAFASANGMQLNGHILIWDVSVPTWVTGGGWSRDTLLQIMKEHITTVMRHYAGKAVSWKVVNEAVMWDGTLRPSYWETTIGPDYIDSAFVYARRADPAAKLYYNDFSIEAPGVKADSVFALLQRLRSRGIPIDGVGFQFHAFPTNRTPAEADIVANFTRFATAGYLVWPSELDVMIPDTSGADSLVSQAVAYRNVLDACLLQPQCVGVNVWGFTDRYSWIPQSWPGYGRGLPLDSAYAAKPAFDSLAARLRRP